MRGKVAVTPKKRSRSKATSSKLKLPAPTLLKSNSQPQFTGGLVQTWIVSALNDDAIPKFIEDADKANLMTAMFNIATKGLKEKGRFKSLIADFVKINKQEITADVLSSYI